MSLRKKVFCKILREKGGGLRPPPFVQGGRCNGSPPSPPPLPFPPKKKKGEKGEGGGGGGEL